MYPDNYCHQHRTVSFSGPCPFCFKTPSYGFVLQSLGSYGIHMNYQLLEDDDYWVGM